MTPPPFGTFPIIYPIWWLDSSLTSLRIEIVITQENIFALIYSQDTTGGKGVITWYTKSSKYLESEVRRGWSGLAIGKTATFLKSMASSLCTLCKFFVNLQNKFPNRMFIPSVSLQTCSWFQVAEHLYLWVNESCWSIYSLKWTVNNVVNVRSKAEVDVS